jgi:hypothetical protein
VAWVRRRSPWTAELSRRDSMLAVCGCLVIAFGAVMIATGAGSRLGGVAVALFGGACTVVPLSTVLARRSGAAPYLDRLEHEGVLVPALVIAASPVKLRMLRLGIACFFGASLILLLAPGSMAGASTDAGEAEFVGWIGTIVFGAAGLISLFTARRPQRVVLLPAGVRWQLGLRPKFAAWEDIEEVGTFEIRGAEFLGLDVRGRARRSSIGIEAFPVDADRLARVIAGCCESPDRRRAIGTQESLEWLVPRAAGGSRRARRGRPSEPRLPRPAAR